MTHTSSYFAYANIFSSAKSLVGAEFWKRHEKDLKSYLTTLASSLNSPTGLINALRQYAIIYIDDPYCDRILKKLDDTKGNIDLLGRVTVREKNMEVALGSNFAHIDAMNRPPVSFEIYRRNGILKMKKRER